MKFALVLFALTLALPTQAGASLKLTIENRYYSDIEEYRPMGGINYYKPITRKLFAYNQWTGAGNVPYEGFQEDVMWFVTRHQVDMYLDRLTLAPGFALMYEDRTSKWRDFYYLRLEYKLID